MIVVINLVVSNAGEGGASFVEISCLKRSSRFCITGEASGKSISCQLAIFPYRMLIALEHVGMPKFMGND